MILANASVGKRVYNGFKDTALLRHHPPPSPDKFEKLVKAAESKVKKKKRREWEGEELAILYCIYTNRSFRGFLLIFRRIEH